MLLSSTEIVILICASLQVVTSYGMQVVKIADFGVARVLVQSGVMTAETGTYRWMAPEVCLSLFFSSS